MRCTLWLIVFMGVTACAVTQQTGEKRTLAAKSSQERRWSGKHGIDALRAEVRQVLQAQAGLMWQSWALGQKVNFAEVYSSKDTLFSLESIRALEKWVTQEQDETKARNLKQLRMYLIGEYLASVSSNTSSSISSIIASSIVNANDQELNFFEVIPVLANEAHTGRRRNIRKAAHSVVLGLNSLFLEREKQFDKAAQEIGYASYGDFLADLRQVEFASLAADAEQVLQQTEKAYLKGMADLAREELRMPLKQVRSADIPRLFRTGRADFYFPKKLEIEFLKKTLHKMGINLGQLSALQLDYESRPRKNPRSLTVAFEPGKDVRVSIRPADGLSAWAQLWYEMGHALRYTWMRNENMEVQLLASPGIGMSLGFFLENLLANPNIISSLEMSPENQEGYLRRSSIRKMYRLRRAAGRVIFESEWRQKKGVGVLEDRYQQIMTRALGFPAESEDGEWYLFDNDDFFQSAEEMRALLVAGQLETFLQKSVGEKWWSDEKTGKVLSELFAKEGMLTVEDLVIGLEADERIEVAAGSRLP